MCLKLEGGNTRFITGEAANLSEGDIFISGSVLTTVIDLNYFPVNGHSSHFPVGVCISFPTSPTSAKCAGHRECRHESRLQRGHEHHHGLEHLIRRDWRHHSQRKQVLPAADRKVTYNVLLLL